jgi:hypothetical protein
MVAERRNPSEGSGPDWTADKPRVATVHRWPEPGFSACRREPTPVSAISPRLGVLGEGVCRSPGERRSRPCSGGRKLKIIAAIPERPVIEQIATACVCKRERCPGRRPVARRVKRPDVAHPRPFRQPGDPATRRHGPLEAAGSEVMGILGRPNDQGVHPTGRPSSPSTSARTSTAMKRSMKARADCASPAKRASAGTPTRTWSRSSTA